MGHVPENSEWFIADLVMEITVYGVACNVIHRNLTLVHANSAEEAHGKAMRFGYESESSYDNPRGQLVEIKFRGIAKLDVLYEDLEDGAELLYEERRGMSSEEIKSLIPPKEELSVFVPPKPREPGELDYASGEVVGMAVEMMRRPKNKPDEPD